jgi:hypothetical protein
MPLEPTALPNALGNALCAFEFHSIAAIFWRRAANTSSATATRRDFGDESMMLAIDRVAWKVASVLAPGKVATPAPND